MGMNVNDRKHVVKILRTSLNAGPWLFWLPILCGPAFFAFLTWLVEGQRTRPKRIPPFDLRRQNKCQKFLDRLMCPIRVTIQAFPEYMAWLDIFW